MKERNDNLEELRIPADDPLLWEEFERSMDRQVENPERTDGGVIVIEL